MDMVGSPMQYTERLSVPWAAINLLAVAADITMPRTAKNPFMYIFVHYMHIR